MYSIAFPNMLKSANVSLVKDHEATSQNLKLVLSSVKTSLLGDPDYGTNLRRRLFNQNNGVLKDLLIDDIYTAIITYMPQLLVKRSDITITFDKVDVFATIKCINLIDYQINLYTINLTSEEV